MITGVILAGGLNRRMGGRLKALLPIEGQPILMRQLNEMSKICKQVIIVTNDLDVLMPLLATISDVSVQCITDQYVQKGPLSGIHAAALAASEPLLWIVGCDMPFISAKAAQAMGQLCQEANLDAVIPVLDGRTHPLHGIYSRLVGLEAESLITQEQYRLMGLLDHMDWLPAENVFFIEKNIPIQFVTNVNTPKEYEAMLENLSS